jgi:hypothetical protein
MERFGRGAQNSARQPFWCIAVIVAGLLLLVIPNAKAARPFVTDTASIIDRGQVDVQSWLLATRTGGEWSPGPAFNVQFATSMSDWLGITTGSAVGRGADGQLGFSNPLIQTKVLFRPAEENGSPGFAVATGVTFDAGRGDLRDEGSGFYLTGITSWSFYDDWLALHVNYGPRMERARGGSRRIDPFWGVGLDVGTFDEDIRFHIEAYAGDPLEINSPQYASQFGFRWRPSDYTTIDLSFGLQPEMDEQRRTTGSLEVWGQLGLRMVFDVFTRGGKPGDPDGAPGMFPANR